jgi:SAM-dependent methyltransferase
VSSADLSDPLIARDQAIARLQCPSCTGMLVPALDDRTNPLAAILCLDCERSYEWKHGVLDLVPSDRRLPARRRNHALHGPAVSFFSFFEQSLSTQAYADTDVDDQLYHLLDWLDYQPGEPVLLVGCGQGEVMRLLGDACNDSLLVALDDDMKELVAARAAQVRAGLPGVFVRCDLDRPPARAGTFAAVVHFGVLHAMPDSLRHLKRLTATIPPGGRLVGVCLARSTLGHVARSQEALAQQTGLQFVPMDDVAGMMVRNGWARFRHEQPSNWMARFRAVRP